MKTKYFIVIVFAFCLVTTGAWAQTVTTCYPTAAANNTGSTDGTTITQTSLVNAYYTDDGWMKFDTTAISDVDNIVSIEWNFYVNATNYPFWSSTPLSADPIGADPATLNADIVAEAAVGYYNYQNESSTYAPGWKVLTMGGTANADMAAGLAADWFAFGVATRDSSLTYYLVMDGWNEVNVPYLVVTHTAGSVPTCEDDLVSLGAMNCADTLTFSGDTTGATNWCGNASGDAHFDFEVLEAGDYTITLCSAGTSFDTYLRLYDIACCSNQIAYSDDDSGCASSTLQSTIEVALVPGVYYVHVEGYSANEGLYDLTITCEPEAVCAGLDTCDEALLITPGSYAGDTSGCTNAFSNYSLWSWALVGNDHVYAIDVPCVESEICVTLTPLDGQDPAVGLGMECSDGATSINLIAGADNGLGGDPEAFCYTTTGAEVGTMYIFVDSYGTGSEGAYTLDVTVTSPVSNDTCDTAIDVSAGGVFNGTNECADDDYSGAGCGFGWTTPGNDVVYSFTVDDACTVDLGLIPLEDWDPAIYVVGDCGDIVGTCAGGADDGFEGDPEYLTLDLNCGGTYYVIVDSYYPVDDPWAYGLFDLEVDILCNDPVDTFDVSMLCDPDPLTLPVQTKIRVYVTNTFDVMRQYCGTVGVTLCTGGYISNVRSGSMVVGVGETKFIGWGQVIPAYPTTCDCTLVFDVEAWDCTPCEDNGMNPGGWVETATCGITTVCPVK